MFDQAFRSNIYTPRTCIFTLSFLIVILWLVFLALVRQFHAATSLRNISTVPSARSVFYVLSIPLSSPAIEVRFCPSNEKFVNGAPEQVVASERAKEADAVAKIEVLQAQLEALG